jgi:hypothetical protein
MHGGQIVCAPVCPLAIYSLELEQSDARPPSSLSLSAEWVHWLGSAMRATVAKFQLIVTALPQFLIGAEADVLRDMASAVSEKTSCRAAKLFRRSSAAREREE